MVCQKNGFGYCRSCYETTEQGRGSSCTSPDVYCKFRQECVINYKEKKLKKRFMEGE